MGLFDWLILGPVLGPAIRMINDGETNAKKAGYKRAAEEYGVVYEELKSEYAEAQQILGAEYADRKNYIDKLNNKLQWLEDEEQRLKLEISMRKAEHNSGTLNGSVAGGFVFWNGILKMFEAEQQGYNEAKELYMEKIEELQTKLQRIEIKSSRINSELDDVVDNYLRAIQEKQFDIANLKMKLQVISEYEE